MLLSYHELPFWGMGMFRLRQVGGGFWRGARGRDLLLKRFAFSFIFLFHFVIIVHLMNVFNLFSDAGGKYETYNGVNIGLKWKVEHEGGQIQRCSICCLLLLHTLRIPMWQEMYFKGFFQMMMIKMGLGLSQNTRWWIWTYSCKEWNDKSNNNENHLCIGGSLLVSRTVRLLLPSWSWLWWWWSSSSSLSSSFVGRPWVDASCSGVGLSGGTSHDQQMIK